ncbi:hypothetical protein EVC10_047 [Rhizobium phage RHph_Y25]|nr:hypothetical protein EVC10_047 [Rhizobium phage RHph_Y25]
MEITNTTVSRREGAFDWAHPSEKQAEIHVSFSIDGERYSICDTVEIGSQFDYDGDDISEAVDAIDCALDRYWISTSRDKTKANIAVFKANEQVIRKSHAASLARHWQKRAADASKRARAFMDEATAEAA